MDDLLKVFGKTYKNGLKNVCLFIFVKKLRLLINRVITDEP